MDYVCMFWGEIYRGIAKLQDVSLVQFELFRFLSGRMHYDDTPVMSRLGTLLHSLNRYIEFFLCRGTQVCSAGCEQNILFLNYFLI